MHLKILCHMKYHQRTCHLQAFNEAYKQTAHLKYYLECLIQLNLQLEQALLGGPLHHLWQKSFPYLDGYNQKGFEPFSIKASAHLVEIPFNQSMDSCRKHPLKCERAYRKQKFLNKGLRHKIDCLLEKYHENLALFRTLKRTVTASDYYFAYRSSCNGKFSICSSTGQKNLWTKLSKDYPIVVTIWDQISITNGKPYYYIIHYTTALSALKGTFKACSPDKNYGILSIKLQEDALGQSDCFFCFKQLACCLNQHLPSSMLSCQALILYAQTASYLLYACPPVPFKRMGQIQSDGTFTACQFLYTSLM